jgi:hypothetical protein
MTLEELENELRNESRSRLEKELQELGATPLETETPEIAVEEPSEVSAPAQEAPQVVTTAVPTTITDLYYNPNNPQTEQILAKEKTARNTIRMQGADPAITQEQVESARQSLQEVLEYKQGIYDEIQGDNITDIGVGKVVTNPDGTRQFVPGPYSSEVSQGIAKTITDTARGILGLPEFLTGKEELNFSNIVPEVESDNAAVNTISEFVQLGVGAFGGVGLAAKAEKYVDLFKNAPKVKAFLQGSEEFVDDLGAIGRAGKATVRTVGKVVPKGTVSSALGAAAVADEDITTFYGDPDMTMADVKMQVLKESLVFGLVFGGLVETGKKAVEVSPTLKAGVDNIAGGVTALFTIFSKKGTDDKVINLLGETLYENSRRLANAKTPDEIAQINLESYEEIKKAYTQLSEGGDLEKVMAGIEPSPAGGPSLAEVVGDSALLRLEQSLRYSQGGTNANQILRSKLGDSDFARLNELTSRVSRVKEELAPAGREAGEQVREDLEGQVTREMAELTAETEAERRAIQESTRQARQVAQTEKEAVIQTADEAVTKIQDIQIQTADDVSRVLEQSPVSQRNLADLQNQINDDGTVAVISSQLKTDLTTKDALGSAKDQALKTIEIPGEEAQRIVDDLIGTYTNPNFLVDDVSIREAGKEISLLIRTFKSADEGLPPTPPAGGTTPPPTGGPAPTIRPIDAELEAINIEIASGAGGDFTRLLELTAQAKDLMARGAKLPPKTATSAAPPVITDEAVEEAVELPTITAYDLESIVINTQQRANKFAERSLAESDTRAYQLSQGLREYANNLENTLAQYVDTNPVAKQARDDFRVFFDDFKERWRSETGRDWQGTLIGSRTRVDVADAEDKILSVLTNPKASGEDLQVIREFTSKMDEETRQIFTQGIGNRVLADFTRQKGVMPGELGETNVREAARLLDRVDTFLATNTEFEKALPGAFTQMKQIQTDLRAIVSPAVAAQKQAKQVAKESGQAKRAAEAKLKETQRELTQAEKESLASVQQRLSDAQSEYRQSALFKLIDPTKGYDDPATYVGSLLTSNTGFKQYQQLWNAAGKTGDKLPSGLTETQEALQETTIFALLNKVQPVQREEVGKFPDALKLLVDTFKDPKTTPGRIFELSLKNNPQSREVLEGLERSLASYVAKREAQALGAQGSSTFEKSQLPKLIDDIQMVRFGPLTQDFRIARFLNRAFFFVFDSDTAVANSFTKVLTDPSYSKAVLDKAAQIAQNKLVPEEEAFNTALISVLLATRGINTYLEADDPDAVLQRDADQWAITQQTEEGLGGVPSPE